jgi:hypothetical protein
VNRAQELRDIIDASEMELEKIERACEHIDSEEVSRATTSDGRRHIGHRCKSCGYTWGEHPDGLNPEPRPNQLRLSWPSSTLAYGVGIALLMIWAAYAFLQIK